ncbi:MAG: Gfo/Idh/MocA family oxidoreductase [Spirochaetales bacterium]|jgi:predicted dehydrogenase|nr:Gfo/Idh/MocA family oxidoreductase [Spirochaetales bacterium]
MERLRVGIIGVGNISGIYLKNLTTVFSDKVELLGCADLLPERAADAASEYDLPRTFQSPQQLLADPDIELVLNLTIPIAHFDVCLAAAEAGKHVYVEKPLCVKLEEAEKLSAAAEAKNVRVGGAPDTFLGAGIQTCRKLIDDGWIGTPIAATAFMQNHGHESWHPDPEFYYKPGAGPMFDMGPYYLTALINLVGPVSRVSGSTRATFAQRTITSEPKNGTVIDVEVPTHVVGNLDFQNGAIGTIITSFDIWAHHLPGIEIYGTEGSMTVPDPNTFGGTVEVKRSNNKDWHSIPLTHAYAENSRGLGVADAAVAIRNDTPQRTSSDLTHHVLEIMHGIHISAETGQRYDLKTPGVRPEAFPTTF